MTFSFRYLSGTKFETVPGIIVETDFYNLKNKAAGPRRYGYVGRVVKATNPEGAIAFRSYYQTTLDGVSYQSSKHGKWVATANEAHAQLIKTIDGAMKRYAKLALDPTSKIERRA